MYSSPLPKIVDQKKGQNICKLKVPREGAGVVAQQQSTHLAHEGCWVQLSTT